MLIDLFSYSDAMGQRAEVQKTRATAPPCLPLRNDGAWMHSSLSGALTRPASIPTIANGLRMLSDANWPCGTALSALLRPPDGGH